jgi:hypothetical protein
MLEERFMIMAKHYGYIAAIASHFFIFSRGFLNLFAKKVSGV